MVPEQYLRELPKEEGDRWHSNGLLEVQPPPQAFYAFYEDFNAKRR